MSSKIKRHKFDWRANFEKSKKFQEEVKAEKERMAQFKNNPFETLEIWKEPKKIIEYPSVYTKIHLIHWYFESRKELKLTDIEKFHFTMLNYSDFDNKFNEIHFNIALDDINNEDQKTFINDQIKELTRYGIAKITTQYIENNKTDGELNTWLKIFDYTYERKDRCLLFYSHFKGVSRTNDTKKYLNVKYWNFLMYHGCLNDGFQNAMNILEENISYGALINNHCVYTSQMYKDVFDNITELRPISKAGVGQHYTGTFYWLNLEKLKEYLVENHIEKHSFSKLSERMTCEFYVNTLSNGKLKSFFKESHNWYLGYTENRLPNYKVRYDYFWNECKKRVLKSKKILVYTYLENYNNKSPIIFNKECGIDYLFITDKEKSNYEKTIITKHDVYENVFDENRYHKFKPWLLNEKDYDYIIYHDSSIDVIDVKGLINSTSLSKYGINMCKHPISKSINEELTQTITAKKITQKEYTRALKAFENIGTLTVDMPEATVIVYEMKKLDDDILLKIFEQYIELGIHRDQVVISAVLNELKILTKEIFTIDGFIPFKGRTDTNKNLRLTPYRVNI